MILTQEYVEAEDLQLQLYFEFSVFLEVCLFDEIGNLSYNFCDYIKPGTISHQIDTKNLPGGTYLLRIAENGNTKINDIVHL